MAQRTPLPDGEVAWRQCGADWEGMGVPCHSEGGREGGREGGMEEGREGGRREGEREVGRERGREGGVPMYLPSLSRRGSQA